MATWTRPDPYYPRANPHARDEVSELRAKVREERGDNDTLRARVAELARECDRQKIRGDNHVETLRGVRRWIRGGDTARALLWISDGLSGYTERPETTLAAAIERAESAEAQVTELSARLERARQSLMALILSAPYHEHGDMMMGVTRAIQILENSDADHG